LKASCGYNVFWTIAKSGFRNQAEPEYGKIFLQNFHIKCIVHFAGTSLIFELSFIYIIDAQSFSNSLEGVHGVLRKSGRGSSIFVFY
jgi:hypothetical protein